MNEPKKPRRRLTEAERTKERRAELARKIASAEGDIMRWKAEDAALCDAAREAADALRKEAEGA